MKATKQTANPSPTTAPVVAWTEVGARDKTLYIHHQWYQYDDGGRGEHFKGLTGDCVTRAIAIATGIPYKVVYDAINELAKGERITKRRRSRSNARTGVHKDTKRKYLESLGWVWVPTMHIGQGCKVHLRGDELPTGRLVVAASKHSVAVVDGVVHDTYDSTRNGTRCVYGYFYNPEND